MIYYHVPHNHRPYLKKARERRAEIWRNVFDGAIRWAGSPHSKLASRLSRRGYER